MADESGAAKFWRCGKCGTPNAWAGYLTNCVGCGSPRPAHPELLPTKRPREQGGAGRVRGRVLTRLSFAYLGVLILLLAAIRGYGDRWLIPTALMFAPRWVWLAPIGGLAIAAGLGRRKGRWALLGAELLLVLGPLMGFSAPIRSLYARPARGFPVRILSLNLDGDNAKPERVIELIEKNKIDVVFLQEYRSGFLPARLDEYFTARKWTRGAGNRVLTRLTVASVPKEAKWDFARPNLWSAEADRLVVKASDGRLFGIVSLHLPTMRHGLNALSQGDFTLARRHLAWRFEQCGNALAATDELGSMPILIGGDFNMPTESRIFRFLARSYRIAYDEAGWGYGYTKPSRPPWIRIDHVIGTAEWFFKSARVGADVGSDHLPLIVEAILPAGETGVGGSDENEEEKGSRP